MRFFLIFFLAVKLYAASQEADSSSEENTREESVEFLEGRCAELGMQVEEKVKEKLEKLESYSRDRFSYSTPHFKQITQDYLKKHLEAVYAMELESPGSGLGLSMGPTRCCLAKKHLKEVEFLCDDKNPYAFNQPSPFLVRIWLGDAEPDFWKDIEPDLLKENAFARLLELAKKQLQSKFKCELQTGKDAKYAFLNLDESYRMRADYKKNQGSVSFSEEEVSFFVSMEETINEAFVKVLSLFKSNPVSLRCMIDGHSAWLEYRVCLLHTYENLDVDDEVIKIRLLCLDLARLYFYTSYYGCFSLNNGEKGCLVGYPREYDTMYDCNAVRQMKGVPPLMPCFPE